MQYKRLFTLLSSWLKAKASLLSHNAAYNHNKEHDDKKDYFDRMKCDKKETSEFSFSFFF